MGSLEDVPQGGPVKRGPWMGCPGGGPLELGLLGGLLMEFPGGDPLEGVPLRCPWAGLVMVLDCPWTAQGAGHGQSMGLAGCGRAMGLAGLGLDMGRACHELE
jgi:hypothetical protein